MVTSSWPRATPAALTRSSSMAQFNQLFEGRIRHVLQALAFMGESAVAGFAIRLSDFATNRHE